MDLAASIAVVALAVVLIAAGAGKLARPPEAVHLAALGIPPRLRAPWAVRLHAAGEIVLGLALIGAPGILLAVLAAVTAALSATYLVVAWRAWRSPTPVACHCFGLDDDRPAGPAHVVLDAAMVVASGVVLAAGLRGWWAVESLHPGVIAVGGALGALGVVESTSAFRPRGDGRERPYLRRPIPAGRVWVDGGEHELADLARDRAQLLLRIPRLGRQREYFDAAIPRWRRRLPHVDVRTVTGGSGFTLRRLGLTGSPTAVVLGADGLLAGGPVTGYDPIAALVDELARTRPSG